MNVFGAFTFGSLIKTFIPGFVWLAALWLLWHGIRIIVPIVPPVPVPPIDQLQNLLVASVPAAILFGLLSNIVIFMGVNDFLIRGPVRRRMPALFTLYEAVTRRVRDEYWDQFSRGEAGLKRPFIDYADAEILVLETIGVENLAYVREQYWFHMEFQVNLLLAIFTALIGILAGLIPDLFGAAWRPAAEWTGLTVVVLGGVCCFLLKAARKNYQRHVAKMTSLLVATLCGEPRGRVHASAPNA